MKKIIILTLLSFFILSNFSFASTDALGEYKVIEVPYISQL